MKVLPVAADAWRFVVPSVIIGAALVWWRAGWSIVLGGLSLLFAVACLFFFRDFDRSTTVDDRLLYSPGDGRVLEVAASDEYPSSTVVRIFLSVLDGHVQRAPVSGTVEDIRYKKGTFLDARNPRAHIDNEQNTMTLSTNRGRVMIRQVAGLIARRIVCWAKVGDGLAQGERYGLIRFGSQVDVFFPNNVEVAVKAGDRVLGGETVLGRWPS